MPETPIHPAVARVIGAAAKKGVTLEIHDVPEGAHTAEDAAAGVGAEIGQIVKSLSLSGAARRATRSRCSAWSRDPTAWTWPGLLR